MYTGKTEQPCCLCDNPETVARVDLPPRAINEMKHGDPIAWQDVIGEVSVHFCESDWELVQNLVLEMGMSPLPRCNAARASFDLREDFEALTNQQKAVQDHSAREQQMLADANAVLDGETQHDPTNRALVEARVIRWVVDNDA